MKKVRGRKWSGRRCGAHQNSAAVGKFTDGSVEAVCGMSSVKESAKSLVRLPETWDFADRTLSRFDGTVEPAYMVHGCKVNPLVWSFFGWSQSYTLEIA